jgi:hypothetical protein
VRALNIVVTFHFVCFAWIFFRAASVEQAWQVLERIGSLTVGWSNLPAPLLVILAIAVAAHYFPKRWADKSAEIYAAAPFFVQALALALLVLGLEFVATTGSTPFIYTKF